MKDQQIHPRILNNKAIEDIRDRRGKAETEMYRLCSGERKWTMCVPAQDDDTDVLLDQAFKDSARLEQEVYRLRGEVKRLCIDRKKDIPDEIWDKLMAIVFEEG